MRKIILFFALLMISAGIFATSPQKVELKFDKSTGILEVIIKHKSKDVEKHYIDEVIVEVNGEEVAVETIEEQSDKVFENLEFTLEDVNVGDEIKVIAKCNKFGRKSEKLEVE